MTDQDISTLFRRYKQYAAQISILQDCVDIMQDGEHDESQENYAVLRKLAFGLFVFRSYYQTNQRNICRLESGDHPLSGRDGAHFRKQSGDTGNAGQTGGYDQSADFHGVTSLSVYQTMGMVSNS